ncbi:hypothetical protein BLA60_06885 [Actinophytocola xinjiangensis]|uniref:Uncharacterized protein n=1 Tax=Actinophytocola xinjiangensis TaxID=485602 RepID=A0A7Z1B091_9PSEU|nr:hypothetical protein [Actinophytocola xinjiangensis]OLF12968.1 hypothetical protein BLA60_06885 [Actinophytocola xinjiangensis]
MRDVVTHVQACGRPAVDPALLAALRAVEPTDPLLAAWLPCLLDHERPGFDTYAAVPVLEQAAAAQRDPEAAFDELIAALLADLLLVETTALAARPTPAQRLRTLAGVRAVARSGDLAPRARARIPDITDTSALVATAAELARTVLRRTPPALRTAVGAAVLPMTTLHDEIVVIRCAQVTELLYRRLGARLKRAVHALRRGELAEAVTQVDDASARLAASAVIVRLLATLPRDRFQVIREHTRGRGAAHTRAVRELTAHRARLSPPRASGLADALAVFDRAWRAVSSVREPEPENRSRIA